MFDLKQFLQEGLSSMVTLKPEPRNEIWASDLGKPFIDRFLSMKGTPYSNPSDGYSMQNFIVGSGLEKAFINQLQICMIPVPEAKRIKIERAGCLPVVGRSDVLLEVKDWSEVEARIDEYVKDTEISDLRIAKKLRLLEVVNHWKKLYPNGIPKSVYEIKSINSWALKYHKTDQALLDAYPHYTLQLVAYMLGHNLTEGGLIFIAKDTGKNYGFIKQIPVKLTKELEDKFWKDVETFSKYFLNDQMPPKEPLMVNGKLNWRVRYCSYFEQIYKKDVEALQQNNSRK